MSTCLWFNGSWLHFLILSGTPQNYLSLNRAVCAEILIALFALCKREGRAGGSVQPSVAGNKTARHCTCLVLPNETP